MQQAKPLQFQPANVKNSAHAAEYPDWVTSSHSVSNWTLASNGKQTAQKELEVSPHFVTMHERAADRGTTIMQMRVSLGEERPGTAVEKHMGLGHPNVHLRETIPQIFFDPSNFFFV